jgi:hypothetical protein
MTRGELPSRAQAELLEAALTAGVEHGPQAPSIAIARIPVTCGVDLNNAVGILAHAWEQTEQGGRNKGPIPRQFVPSYNGPPVRRLP